MGVHQLPLTTTPRNPRELVTIDRERLESLIASAIEMLDLVDGDADFENYNADEEDDDPDYCLAGDDGMKQMRGEDGRLHWGSHEHNDGVAPDYGIDQTADQW